MAENPYLKYSHQKSPEEGDFSWTELDKLYFPELSISLAFN